MFSELDNVSKIEPYFASFKYRMQDIFGLKKESEQSWAAFMAK